MPAVVVIGAQGAREQAARWVEIAQPGTRIEFKKPVRSLPQNDKLWAMLTELATQLPWHGQKLTPEDWKDVLTAGLKRELRMVPNADNDGFVMLGMRTSRMSKDELSELLEFVAAFGARHGVTFKDSPPPPADAEPEGEPPLGAKLTEASDSYVLRWAAVFEARLRKARDFEIAAFWGSAHQHGRLARLRQVDEARYAELEALMHQLAAPQTGRAA